MGIFVMVVRCGVDQVVHEGLELEEVVEEWVVFGW